MNEQQEQPTSQKPPGGSPKQSTYRWEFLSSLLIGYFSFFQ